MYSILYCLQCLNKFEDSSTAVVLVDLLVRGHHLVQEVLVEREARDRGEQPAKVLIRTYECAIGTYVCLCVSLCTVHIWI